ncbi:hypothetical protein GNT65_16740 [Shewanella sp. JBTF-M18]|uniref:Uncharacterized protein n=1 Tax=Shewanella insulae TaxID=2681496 RepID=A0A6L7I172_9GAMM|nr:competence protein CoiA family protein [Shewanella insulae]MXR70307.1 hypothetical protein [Shewanella insulae]
MSGVKIAWGLGYDGVMRHISEVEKGKACGCICPSINCSSPLIANKGDIKAHYFSHQANTGCGGESALHLAAKQILEESALDQSTLVLPEIHGYYSCADMSGEIIEQCRTETPCFQIVEAKQEVRLSIELIADVVCQSDKNEKLAVEIFVTNAKGELGENKYKSIGMDAIEIDLSMLSWNVSRDELKRSVLQNSNRRWLQCSRRYELERELKIQVDDAVKSIDQGYLTSVYDMAKYLSNNHDMPSFTWPSLKATRTLSNSNSFTVFRTPKITHFHDEWFPFAYGYKGRGIVEGKVNVDVILFVVSNHDRIAYSENPTLLISFDERADTDFSRFHLGWLNIESWKRKLELIADNELMQKEVEAKQKVQKVSSFVCHFKEADDKKKMEILCQKLGLPLPKQASKHIFCWNASQDVWRTVVWTYKIHGNEGYTIDSRSIADDPWLESLLGFSVDDRAYEHRRKMVGFWLKKLFELGILRRVGWSKYEVENSQLKNFLPWQFIK